MATRTLCATIFAALIALTGCTDKSSYFSKPSGPDSVTDGGNGPGNTPTPKPNDVAPIGDETTDKGSDSGGGNHPDPIRTDEGPDAPEPVPEPTTILLFGVGVTGLAFYRRRRRTEPCVRGV
jgi:PEP-CTERM motif